MGKIKLTEEDLRVLSDCISNQTEIPDDLLFKLSPAFSFDFAGEAQSPHIRSLIPLKPL